MSKAGFPVSKETLLLSAHKLAVELKLEFGDDNKPDSKWYSLFRARHPEISLRTGQNLTLRRAK